MRAIDTLHLGRRRWICCWQVGEVLIDPGPTLALEHVLERRHCRRCFIECDVRFTEEELEVDRAAHVEELAAFGKRLE